MSPRHYLAVVLVALIWGVNFAVTKWGLAQMPPIALVALRFAAVAAILLPFLNRPRRRFGRLVALSVTLGSLHFPLSFVGLKGLDVATAAIAIQLQVPFAAILAAIFYKETLGWRRLLGMAIAFAGVVVIAGEPRFSGDLGPLLTIITAACIWAGTNIQMKQIGDELDVLSLNGWVALLAVPQLLLASWLLEDGQLDALRAAGWQVWGSVAYQAILVTVVGYGIWYQMMRRFPVNQVMPFTLLVPVFGVLSGVLLMGERLSLPMLIGGFGTIIGVAIIVVRRPRVIAPATKSGL